MDDEERVRLFDLLYDAVGKRKIEEIHLVLGVKLQAVYRYLPNAKKRVIPNYRTAARIVEALKQKARHDDIIHFLDLAAGRMRETQKAYMSWRGKPLKSMTQRRHDTEIIDQASSQKADWRESLREALNNAGCYISSVPEDSEEAILHVLNILNYIRRPEPTKEMKADSIEKGLRKLYGFLIENV